MSFIKGEEAQMDRKAACGGENGQVRLSGGELV